MMGGIGDTRTVGTPMGAGTTVTRRPAQLVFSDQQAVQWVRSLHWILATALADPDPSVGRAVLVRLLQTHVASRPALSDPNPTLLASKEPPLPQRTLRRLGAWAEFPPKGGWVAQRAAGSVEWVWEVERRGERGGLHATLPCWPH